MSRGDVTGVLLAGFSGFGGQDHQSGMYLPAIEAHPGLAVLAVCPSGAADEKRAMVAAQRLGVPCLPDLDAGLAVPGVRAVSVAFPPAGRGEAIATVLRAGRHVLADKPLAATLPEAEAVLGLAAGRELVLLPAHHQRWSPAVRSARTALAGGQVGLPWNAQADFLVAGGDVAPGGELLNLALYPVDIVRFLLGLPAVRVHARAGSYWHDGPDPDFAEILVEYASGVTAAITAGRMAELPGVAAAGLARHRYRISGSHGVLAVDGGKPGLRVRAAAGASSAWAGPGTVAGLVDDFHRAITAGQPLSVSAQDVLEVHRVLAAATDSLAAGRPVPVPGSAQQ